MVNKKKPKKKKMVLAKDPKQAITAIVVIVAFLFTTIYNLIAYHKDQMAYVQPSGDAAMMAQKQQHDLESLQNPELAQDLPQDANDIYSKTMELNEPKNKVIVSDQIKNESPVGHNDGDIEIMTSSVNKNKSGKKVLITVAASGRSNPFLPAGENFDASSSFPGFTMLPPPEQLAVNSDASAVMGTTISGILFDKYSPSAIITIAGIDYLVKKGDIINRYNILSITKDQVVVQLGKNIYKAGVGQLLAEGQINYNTIANLNKKFGGNEVSINVRKKGY